jgi:hypothetical protein
MNIDRLLSFTRNPALLKQDDSQDLEGLVAEYPYFSATQLLLAMKYQQQNSSRYNRQLQKTAVYMADRDKFMSVLHAEIDQLNSFDLQWDKMAEASANTVSETADPEMVAAQTSATSTEPTQESATLSAAEEIQADSKVEEVATSEQTDDINISIESATDSSNGTTTDLAIAAQEEEAATTISNEIASDTENALTAAAEAVKAVEEFEVSADSIIEAAVEVDLTHETPVEAAAPVEDVAATAKEAHSGIEEKATETGSTAETAVQSQVEETELAAPTDTNEESATANVLVDEAEIVLDTSQEVLNDSTTTSAEKDIEKIGTAPFEFILPAQPGQPQQTSTVETTVSQPSLQEFSQKPHDRLSWFRFFAGKPLREQPDEVLEALYQEHMGGDFLQAPAATIAEIKSDLKAVINHETEVASNKALESEIRRLAYESISDEELPASETLAGIYESQQDYKRALRIYQKLMLKFPDRMSYFAGLIEQTKTKLTN